jgi:hypothetical protein
MSSAHLFRHAGCSECYNHKKKEPGKPPSEPTLLLMMLLLILLLTHHSPASTELLHSPAPLDNC